MLGNLKTVIGGRRPKPPRGALLLSCLSGLALLTRPAAGHAPPQATGVFSSPAEGAEPGRWVRTNRGVISKSAPGDAPRLLCNAAYGASLSEIPPLIAAPDGLVLAAYEPGLVRISEDGCDVRPIDAELGDRHVIDLAPAADGSRYFALLAPSLTAPGGVLVSTDAGRTWTAAAEMKSFGSALRVAPSDPDRVYVTAQAETESGVAQHELFVSSDGAATFSVLPVTLLDSEVRAFVLGVDPLDAERVFLRTLPGNSEAAERLLLSEDGGQNFSEVHAAQGPLALAIDAGATWLGGVAGLFRSGDRGRSFEGVPGAPSHIGCLVTSAGSLSICGYQDNEFGVFESASGAAPFQSELRFPEVTQQVACSEDAEVLALCETDFLDWMAEQAPAAPAGASGGAAASEPREPVGGSGCHVGAGPGDSSACLAVPLALLYSWRWRRARSVRRKA